MRIDRRRIVLALAIAAPIVLLALDVLARPGGGSSYSGGSRGGGGGFSGGGGGYSGGGGGGGGGDGIAALIILCIEYPYIGIPIVIFLVFIGIYVKRMQRRMGGSEWTAGIGGGGFVVNANAPIYANTPPPRPQPIRGRLEGLRRTDPAFSIVVFEDFLYFLYAEMHRARGSGAIEQLSAYVGDGARPLLRNDGRIAEVTGIIIGAIEYESVNVDADARGGGARVTVIVESNYVERYRPQGEARFYVKERLHLARAAGAKSRTPDKARTLNCPNCGAPLSEMQGKTCKYCHTTVESGSKDWAIQGLEVLAREPRGPLLTSNVEEEGTDLPTIVDPNAQATFAQIQAKDPASTNWQRVSQRIGVIFQEFHAGWVARDPSRVRPFVSDNLFQSQLYWIDLYKQSHCINRTDGAAITNLELANATTDAFFDSITVRLYATGLDYTIAEDGRLLSGSKSVPRRYSEYWTIIRGAQRKGASKGDRNCPNCGAPLQINMTGNCTHCQAKVTTGEYDWVLSRIEQDEAYSG